MTRLYCEPCDAVFAEHECNDCCPTCSGPVRDFNAPEVFGFFATGEPGFMFSLPDATPAEELAVPAGVMFRKQAGAR